MLDAIKRTTPPGFAELAALAAAAMALNALAIDMMLPALGLIGDDLNLANANDRQLIVGLYLIGNGLGQLLFGPLVDRFGRRPILIGSLGAYLVGSILSIIAGSFTLLLAARIFQGVATAGSRVSIFAIIRDRYAGRRMAKLVSFAVTLFMAAPIIAPGIGQAILLFSPWRGIFVALFLYGFIVTVWAFLRLPETLDPAFRTRLNARRIFNAYREFFSDRCASGYTFASALCFGALFGYISAAEQIFFEVFEIGDLFALAFAAVAVSLGIATLTNASFVERFGMRRLTHGALIAFVAINLAHLCFVRLFGDTAVTFVGFLSAGFFCIGLIGPNSSALAMERMGHIAGSAAAANGFASTTVAGMLGAIIGQQFDGTTEPIVAGFAIFSVLSLAVVLWVERGRLFQIGEFDGETSDGTSSKRAAE
ncbi:MAG: MFS transporter [Alphaproteobacteria bacterium]|nr:MFS transporter [Alphaproteobacteria bacterium]